MSPTWDGVDFHPDSPRKIRAPHGSPWEFTTRLGSRIEPMLVDDSPPESNRSPQPAPAAPGTTPGTAAGLVSPCFSGLSSSGKAREQDCEQLRVSESQGRTTKAALGGAKAPKNGCNKNAPIVHEVTFCDGEVPSLLMVKNPFIHNRLDRR